MSDEHAMPEPMPEDNPFKALEPLKEEQVAPAHVVASIALNMAMKYHDIATIKDGAMYQQYKLEGRNMRELHLDMVFETAIQIESHLMHSSDRIAKMMVDAIAVVLEDGEPEDGAENEEAPQRSL